MVSTRGFPADNTHYAVPGHAHSWRQPFSLYAGRDETLDLTGPVGAGDQGYMGRDLGNPASMRYPYNASPGMFRRLHQGQGG
jgi:hypothetical protein